MLLLDRAYSTALLEDAVGGTEQWLRPKVFIEELGGHMDLTLDVVQMFRQCRACEDASIGIGQFGPSLQERWWVA